MYSWSRIWLIIKNFFLDMYFGIWFLWRTSNEPMVDGLYHARIGQAQGTVLEGQTQEVELIRITEKIKPSKPVVVLIPGSGANAHQYRPLLQHWKDMGALYRYDVFVVNQTDLHKKYCNTDDYVRDLDDKMFLIEQFGSPTDSRHDEEIKSDGKDPEIKSDGKDPEIKSDGKDPEIKSDGKDPEIRLVGHSYGGIIASSYVSLIDRPHKLVTVCSPLQGVNLISKLQAFGFLNTARHTDMSVGSLALWFIHSKLPKDYLHWLNIASYGDLQVPAEQAILPGARQYFCNFAHTQIITRPEIAARILQHFA
jgi:pimeloyl-ACP methyl ester carboxylesterase